MNRKDTKYFFGNNKLLSILTELQPDYRILEIDGNRVFSYKNIYFDTSDFLLYQQHHNQRVNRYKIRVRQYVESRLNYLEVKFKNNTGRTIKSRIQVPEFSDTLSDTAREFLRENTPFNPDHLKQTLYNEFRRFTLVNVNLRERATIDSNLVLQVAGEEKKFSRLCIAELKMDATLSGSKFRLAMRENNCPEMRISKYSVGAAYMYPELKQNTFKPKKIRINRIENDPTTAGN
jgi:hypothetical protein